MLCWFYREKSEPWAGVNGKRKIILMWLLLGKRSWKGDNADFYIQGWFSKFIFSCPLQTNSPKLLKGWLGAEHAGGELMGPCLFVLCLRTLICHLLSNTLPITTLFMNQKGAKNNLENSTVSWEMLCKNVKCNTWAPLTGNVCPGAGIGYPGHTPTNCKRSLGW